jgi:diaminohydroxyphosphoribosylaminopyrimidine deaminase/5-amino-6-(5-phosphoribosylamino)uracil reductase
VIATLAGADAERERVLRERGAEVIRLGTEGGGVSVAEVLKALWGSGVRRLLLESGGKLAASFFAAGAVDQVVAFVAPKVAGGASAPTPVEGTGVSKMGEALGALEWYSTKVGEDLRLTALFPEGTVPPAGA